eukprot:CAMPEP_0206253358 /NCGR_PEP_ID=MMETSP0047_2-20121206/23108_1 /ASSEMBLY_ACC=CAM_ASM_000192 /TAXON_ID=195065 /ORGANISM="Chroomonas mesostigmatica_cf, Strain CCMP1168" /LENGTH=72 /DNA_ID=CAMNT_0053679559 /DNA_START=190 /DNA_END=408 /DNA_ORIENTATION=-
MKKGAAILSGAIMRWAANHEASVASRPLKLSKPWAHNHPNQMVKKMTRLDGLSWEFQNAATLRRGAAMASHM